MSDRNSIAPGARANAPQGEIAALFAEWLVLKDAGFDQSLSDEQADANNARYVELQARIVDMEPVTAGDFAAQLLVETDFCMSDWREVFEAKAIRLAGGDAR